MMLIWYHSYISFTVLCVWLRFVNSNVPSNYLYFRSVYMCAGLELSLILRLRLTGAELNSSRCSWQTAATATSSTPETKMCQIEIKNHWELSCSGTRRFTSRPPGALLLRGAGQKSSKRFNSIGFWKVTQNCIFRAHNLTNSNSIT